MPKITILLSIALLNGLLGALFFITSWGAAIEENFGLGWLFQARGPHSPPEEVVLVSMDTESMKTLELERVHHKWPRALHAKLVDRLAAGGAAFIAFDVYFREAREQVSDAALAQAMMRAGNVLLFQQVRKDLVAGGAGGTRAFTEQLMDPLPPFRDAAAALAPFTLPGVPVKVSQFWKFKPETGDTPTLPALAFQYYALSAYDDFIALLKAEGAGERLPSSAAGLLDSPGLSEHMNQIRLTLRQSPGLGEKLRQMVVDTGVGLAPNLRALVNLYTGSHSQYLNYYGPPRSIRSVPYHQVLAMSEHELAQFKGKAVFVGVSEAFQWDQVDTFYTVYSNSRTGHNIAGVEIAATAFSNLLQEVWVAPIGLGAGALLLLLWGAGIGFICYSLSVGRMVFAVASMALLYLLLAQYCFDHLQLWLPLLIPLGLQILPVLLFTTIAGYRRAQHEKANIAATLGRYLPAQVVEDAARSIQRIGGQGKNVYGVCMATDAANYTRLSERMEPRELRDLLNEYYEVLFEVIHRHGGMVSDVVGDSVLALWVHPEPRLEERTAACHAALDAIEAIDRFNRSKAGLELPTRIGLHFGQVHIGDVGAGQHFEYRAVGDTVNTASRIEGANKTFRTRLLASAEALEGVEGLLTRDLGSVRLVGKSKGIELYELRMWEKDAAEQDCLSAGEFHNALSLFQQGKWQSAYEGFTVLAEGDSRDGPVHYYLKLCERYMQQPPDEPWEGIIELTAK